MKNEKIFEALGDVDVSYLEGAENFRRKRKMPVWGKWAITAACLGLAVFGMSRLGVPAITPTNTPGGTITNPPGETLTNTPGEKQGTLVGNVERPYKNVQLNGQELAIEWPWEYQTLKEQYVTALLAGKEYGSSGMTLDASSVGESLGTAELTGYDGYADQIYTMAAETFAINGILPGHAVAVLLGDEYVTFKDRSWNMPATLGEVLDEYSLAELLPLSRFVEYEGYAEGGSYSLPDDEGIWAVLATCSDAEFVEDDWFNFEGRTSISFTATSAALGAYKKAFRVTADGYLWTNLLEYQYLFYIGEGAAGQIIAYARENAAAAEPETFTNRLAGTLIEIGDSYILVDDGVLCENESDGVIFTVPTEDIRVRRCLEFADVKEGDIVVVSFSGDIDVASGYRVEGAYSVVKGFLEAGDVSVLE
ncbi:MAG: hypothetical protein IKQ96_06615 [Lachnospiraceae bacterium]|nr:hypothetical protein [Lachnospiraceae bacterium]